MKFLVDNQLPAAVAHWLAGKGHDAFHVLDRDLGQADDRQLWALACQEGRTVVSKDEDFFILAGHSTSGSLLWLRVGNCRKQTLLAMLETAWPAIEQALLTGQRVIELR